MSIYYNVAAERKSAVRERQNDWEFAVEELPVEPTDPVGPKTGDDTPVALYAAICAVCAGAVVFLIATRKKKEQ